MSINLDYVPVRQTMGNEEENVPANIPVNPTVSRQLNGAQKCLKCASVCFQFTCWLPCTIAGETGALKKCGIRYSPFIPCGLNTPTLENAHRISFF